MKLAKQEIEKRFQLKLLCGKMDFKLKEENSEIMKNPRTKNSWKK